MKRIGFLLFLSSFLMLGIQAQISDCSECGERLLTERDIEGKSLEELALLRNEIFARNGYTFQNALYENYFYDKYNYLKKESNKDVVLSDIEVKNVEFLKTHENEIEACRNSCIQDFKNLKKALNENNEQIISKYLYNLEQQQKQYEEYGFDCNFRQTIQGILNKIDFDDIHWNRGRGFYGVSIDNGYSIVNWSILFEGSTIVLSYTDPMSHSEIFGDFGDGYSDYMSENESTILFTFEMTEDGIVFQYLDIAG